MSGEPAPANLALPQAPAPGLVPLRLRLTRRPGAVRPSPPSPPPPRAPAPPLQSPEPPPIDRIQELTWLIPPDAAFPADLADAVTPAPTPEPLAEPTPPTPPEAQLSLRFPPLSAAPSEAATPVEAPAPEAPPAAAPPEAQPVAA